uniref:Uncharacterized protein n=1 Tax=Callorhinchus milii TaxID=7868 RepID=A0A4W3ILN3_CALMI
MALRCSPDSMSTLAILFSGLAAASFSFLASNRGLKRRSGRRLVNGVACGCFVPFSWMASHIFVARSSGSGNCGGSSSTTMCFLRRLQPLIFFLGGSAVASDLSTFWLVVVGTEIGSSALLFCAAISVFVLLMVISKVLISILTVLGLGTAEMKNLIGSCVFAQNSEVGVLVRGTSGVGVFTRRSAMGVFAP